MGLFLQDCLLQNHPEPDTNPAPGSDSRPTGAQGPCLSHLADHMKREGIKSPINLPLSPRGAELIHSNSPGASRERKASWEKRQLFFFFLFCPSSQREESPGRD